jgi:hypothetical protein
MKGKGTDGSDPHVGCLPVLGTRVRDQFDRRFGPGMASMGWIWGAGGLYKDFVVISPLSGIRCVAFFSSFACLRRLKHGTYSTLTRQTSLEL